MDKEAYLLADGVKITDPLSQDNLSERIDNSELPTHYENYYKEKEFVPCAFCAAKTPHKFGVTAVMKDGRRGLCGNCCARNIFDDEEHDKLKAKLDKREREVLARYSIGDIYDHLEYILSYQELIDHFIETEKNISTHHGFFLIISKEDGSQILVNQVA